MKCRVCGYELDPNREYCDMCGTKVVVPDSVAATKQVSSTESLKEQRAVPLEYVEQKPPVEIPIPPSAPIYTAEPVKPPAPEPVKPSTPEPVKPPAPEPVKPSASEPVAPSAPEPIKPPAPEPVAPPTPKPVETPASAVEQQPDTISESESEFSWNIYNFPKPKQPGEISIEWPEYDYVDPATGNVMTSDGKIQQAVDKNEPVVIVSKDVSEGFVAVPDQKEFAWEAPMAESTKQAEKFFTFQKKNEEFQRLLDREYEKLMRRQQGEDYTEEPFHSESNAINRPAAPVVRAEELSAFEKMLMDNTADADFVTGDTLPLNLEKVQAEVRAQESARLQQNENAYLIQREIIEKAEQEAREMILNAEMSKIAEEAEAVQKIKSQNRARIDAMSKAREAYFQNEGMDEIPDALNPLPIKAIPQVEIPLAATAGGHLDQLSGQEIGKNDFNLSSIQLTKAEKEGRVAPAGPTASPPKSGPESVVSAASPPKSASEGRVFAESLPKSASGSRVFAETPAGPVRSKPLEAPASAPRSEAPASAQKSETPAEPAASPSQSQQTQDADALVKKTEATFPLADTIDKKGEKKRKKAKKEKKKHGFLKFLLILILIPLLLETAVVGLRTFAPDSDITQTASDIEGSVIAQVLEWANTGKQFLIENLEKMGLKVTSGNGEDFDPADTTPKFDLGALVSTYNKNIKSITESPTLGYETTGQYEVEGLESMTIVSDIPTKEAVYACLISYNSKWVDYVNEGVDKSCLDLLKADGQAYRSALNFSKVGKIKEEFESLMLGEIRYSGTQYYVFVREHIAVTENGDTSLSAYSWLYRLEDVGGDIKILDYTAYKN